MLKNGMVGFYTDKDLKTALKNIKCPIHHIVKPGCDGFVREPNPLAKHFSDDACKEFGLKRWKYKRDRYGNKIPDYRNHYQPYVSALYLKENVYNPINPVCQKCRRCFQ